MSFGRVNRGSIFKLPPASIQNTLIDMALEHQRGRPTGSPPPLTPRSLEILKIKNESGSGLAAGKVLGVGAKLLTTVANESLWFSGDLPTATSKWGVLLRQTPDDAIDDLQMAGLVMASVSVGHASHTHADISAGSATLVSGFHGYPIVWKTSGTGTSDCLINLSGGYERGPLAGKPDSTISDGGSGTVSIWLNGSDSGANETWYLDWMAADSISSGKEAIAFWFPDRQKWVVTNAECE